VCFIAEIKLKDYGSELIEIQDNGSGVENSNFAGLSKYTAILLSLKHISIFNVYILTFFELDFDAYGLSSYYNFSDVVI